MGANDKATQIKIGFPRDLDKTARAKKATLDSLLASRARAWDGYFDGLSLAYIEAHKQHAKTLNDIKENIRNQQEFLKSVVLGVLIPSMVGGGMAALVADKGAALTKAMVEVATKRQAMLATFAVGGASTITEDLVKLEVGNAIAGLAVAPGSEWDSAGATPIEFFIKLRKMVNDYSTDTTHAVERGKYLPIHEYIALLDAHLLSPFIQNAPMDTSILYSDKELAPIMEIFLWVVWARGRETKYWLTQITRATEPDNRGFVGKLVDAGLKDEDALNRVRAYDAVRQLHPILERLRACGISSDLITQGLAGKTDHRILNILWVRLLGQKHKDSLLGDLVANLGAKHPTSALEGKPITKFRRLK